ncbi:SPOR domain-containing protein [Deinococcus hohokamensis]|uniref:SPOR domain-containing protein n=1 Tax=Deinococcus hohokamensis TaxID=309883 RepID=A0ABV9I4N8_9DEIO
MSRPQTAPAPGGARRWPDIMIGVLVLLLLGGFGSLLLRGRTSSEVVSTPSAAPVEETVIPAAPGTSAPDPESQPAQAIAPVQPVPEEPAHEEAAPPTEATAPTQAPATTAPAEEPAPAASAPASATDPVAAAPLAPAPTTTETDPSEVPSAATLPDQPAPPATAPELAPAPVARTGSAVATSEQRTPLRSDYRISLGSFATEPTVRTQTASVSGLGYTVYPIDLGSQVVAQVGPFADEATARQALSEIQRVYPGAVLYPPRGVSLKGAAASPAAATTSAPSSTPVTPATATAPTSPAPAAPAPTPAQAAPATETAASPVYLQVGAFDRIESAQTLVEQLRGEGFAPSVNAPEGRKVTVLVGPFTGAAVAEAQAKLSAGGHDSFQVR